VPSRIQLRRTKGWRLPPGAISVARPTRWGNPYKVKPGRDPHLAVMAFEDGVRFGFPASWQGVRIEVVTYPSLAEIKDELAGKDLACWCLPGQSCHADVLLKLANA
jgi:hypothetical protein